MKFPVSGAGEGRVRTLLDQLTRTTCIAARQHQVHRLHQYGKPPDWRPLLDDCQCWILRSGVGHQSSSTAIMSNLGYHCHNVVGVVAAAAGNSSSCDGAGGSSSGSNRSAVVVLLTQVATKQPGPVNKDTS